MKCHYCHQDIEQVAKITHHPNTVFQHYMCGTCHVAYEYVITNLEEPVLSSKTIFACYIKDFHYELTIYPCQNKATVFYYDFRKAIAVNGDWITGSSEKKVAFHLNRIPNWTPFNIKNKLEKLLIFS